MMNKLMLMAVGALIASFIATAYAQYAKHDQVAPPQQQCAADGSDQISSVMLHLMLPKVMVDLAGASDHGQGCFQLHFKMRQNEGQPEESDRT